jgi:SAM-dependent methyltransferase
MNKSVELNDFLKRYNGVDILQSVDRPPNLSDSLSFLQNFQAVRDALSKLPVNVRALIEGYSCQTNAEGLRKFLAAYGVTTVDISVIDIYDLPSTYQSIGMALPDINFFQGCAGDLKEIAQSQSFDLVVQDFLLNCISPSEIGRVLSEAFRVLKPTGYLILSVTDSSGLKNHPFITPENLNRNYGLIWKNTATHLYQIQNENGSISGELFRQKLQNSIILDPKTDQYTFISPPYGRFEFFAPWEKTLKHIAESNFRVLLDYADWGKDDQGLDCCRHRLIAKPE